MTTEPAKTLQDAGIAFDPERPLPFVQVTLGPRGEPVRPGESLTVLQGETEVDVELPGIRELLTGDQERPNFSEGAVAPYDLLFAAVEGAVADYCATGSRQERDREVQRVYRRLRDRPDGDDRSPFLGHVRAVLRVFLSLHPLSQPAYEAVLEQLLVGVRRLAHGKDSANYVARILKSLAELEAQQLAEQAEEGEDTGEAAALEAPEASEAAPEALV